MTGQAATLRTPIIRASDYDQRNKELGKLIADGWVLATTVVVGSSMIDTLTRTTD